jgi:flagellar biosynthesis protein FliR
LPIDLTPLLPHLPVWSLVLFRLSGIFFYAPIMSSLSIPTRVKVLLVLGLSLCIYPMLLTPGSRTQAMVGHVFANGVSLPAVVVTVGMELLIGLALGFGASLPLIGMELAGQVADQQLGFGLGAIFNPDTDEQESIVSQSYYMLALTIFVILGGHRVVLATLVGSFNHIPLGGFFVDGHLITMMTGLLTSACELALRVSAPLLGLVFLETIAMGFLARTVPQMNIMSIGFALRILIGTMVLIAALSVQMSVYTEYLRRALRDLSWFFAGG